MKNNSVKQLQSNLISLGYGRYMEPYGADGVFGTKTEQAVMLFQRDNNLAIDGIVGENTFAKIDQLLESNNQPYPNEEIENLQNIIKQKNDEITLLRKRIENASEEIDMALNLI